MPSFLNICDSGCLGIIQHNFLLLKQKLKDNGHSSLSEVPDHDIPAFVKDFEIPRTRLVSDFLPAPPQPARPPGHDRPSVRKVFFQITNLIQYFITFPLNSIKGTTYAMDIAYSPPQDSPQIAGGLFVTIKRTENPKGDNPNVIKYIMASPTSHPGFR